MVSNGTLHELATAWMDILETQCPADWREWLPKLDLEVPDQHLSARSLPVLSFLPRMMQLAPAQLQPFVSILSDASRQLHFNQTYTAEDFGAEFLQQYGWVKFLGPDGYWHSDALSSGLVLLGDDVTYPEHWHHAEELYLPLSGSANWYHEIEGWQKKSPGDVIYHASNIKHSMRTDGEPLLILYLWRGGDLKQKSEINR